MLTEIIHTFTVAKLLIQIICLMKVKILGTLTFPLCMVTHLSPENGDIHKVSNCIHHTVIKNLK